MAIGSSISKVFVFASIGLFVIIELVVLEDLFKFPLIKFCIIFKSEVLFELNCLNIVALDLINSFFTKRGIFDVDEAISILLDIKRPIKALALIFAVDSFNNKALLFTFSL